MEHMSKCYVLGQPQVGGAAISVGKAMTAVQFARKVSKFCLAHHAKVLEHKSEYSEAQYVLSTPYGDLRVRAIDDWVACQFVDGVRAKPVTGQTLVAHGKWNFHGTSKSRAQTYQEFEEAVLRILQDQPQGALQ